MFKHFLLIAVVFCAGSAFCSDCLNNINFPIPLSVYEAREAAMGSLSLWQTLVLRVKEFPFNLVATGLFFCAVIHTFMVPKFLALAKRLEIKHALEQKFTNSKRQVPFGAAMCHFLGEVEVVFGIWAVPLMIAIALNFGTQYVTHYFNHVVSFAEPVFVVVIMVIASTRPVLNLAEALLGIFPRIVGNSVKAWWLTILIIAPLFGSLITEPAAMTIAAMLLAKQFYTLEPPQNLRYATLGLLFVNVSIGGTLTHFAAPPILMVAAKWGWGTPEVFCKFGAHAAISIAISTFLYFLVFNKEFAKLQLAAVTRASQTNVVVQKRIPVWIMFVTIVFLVWTVINLHSSSLIIGGLLVFMAFTKSTSRYKYDVNIKSPLLVGVFLAGLVIHGCFQQWWIAPVLGSLNKATLFLGSTVLTAFNDNAAITYLSSLVPAFMHNPVLQQAVVAGAVTGGGLTVIANAPNPAGQNVLSKYFPEGISAMKLFLSAVGPTIIAGICFNLF